MGAPGEPLDWDSETALAVGWDRFKQWWPVLVFAPALVQIVSAVVTNLVAKLGIPGLDTVFSLVLGAFFAVGTLRMFLSAVRGEAPQFEQIFGGGDRMLAMLGTQLLMALAMIAGMIALIVPGIILGLGFMFAPYLCVDQGLGPVEALKKSWAMTLGCKGQLFGFGFVCFFAIVAGLLALVVGVFVAVAVVAGASAWVYLRRRGELVPQRIGG